jgi:hypothetical protein
MRTTSNFLWGTESWVHTHTAVKTHPLGRGGSRQRSAGRLGDHNPIENSSRQQLQAG